MPVKLEIDGGEQHLDFAKKRLALFQQELLRRGQRTGTRHYQLEDAHVEVHVLIPVDVASGQPRPERAQNRIRIEGTAKVGAVIFAGSEVSAIARRISLGERGDDVFKTEGITRLRTKLLLAGHKHSAVSAQSLNVRRLLAKDSYAYPAAGFVDFIRDGERVFAIGDELIYNPEPRVIAASVCGKGVGVLVHLYYDRVEGEESLPPAEAACAFHPDDERAIYEERDLEYKVLIPASEDSTSIEFGSYHYTFSPFASRVQGQYNIDEAIVDAPRVLLGLGVAGNDSSLELARITGTLTVDANDAITGVIVPHFDVVTEDARRPVTAVRAKKSRFLPREELLGPDRVTGSTIIEGDEIVTRFTESQTFFPSPHSPVSPGLIMGYWEYINDHASLGNSRWLSVHLAEWRDAGWPGLGVTEISTRMLYEERQDLHSVLGTFKWGGTFHVTINAPAHSRKLRLLNGREEDVASTGYTLLASTDNVLDLNQENRSYQWATVAFQGGEHVVDDTHRFVLIDRGVLAAHETVSGEGEIQATTYYFYGQQLTGEPFEPLHTNYVGRAAPSNDPISRVDNGFLLHDLDDERDESYGYHNTRTFVTSGEPVVVGSTEDDVRTETVHAVDGEDIRWVAAPDIGFGVFSYESQLRLVLIWPRATNERMGLCILEVDHGAGRTWAGLQATLSEAMEAKRAGQPYEELLASATDMLNYRVNNFASWELVSKFPLPGTYYIVT